MPFYSFEMIHVGIILLSAMTACVVKIWLVNKKENLDLKDDTTQNTFS
jgi:hypothetical protein